jgi:OmpA family protein
MGCRKPLLALCAIAFAVATPAAAQSYFYPSKGQDPSLQSRDQTECGNWAYQQTGFSPSGPPPAAAPQGGALRGAARGAAVGAVGGAIGGNAGKGAAIGAATGGLIGGMRRADQTRQIQAQQAQGASAYNRALGACMQGRGYSVN